METKHNKPSVITSSPEILSGTPVFAGTRVPVQTFIDYLEGGETIDDFLSGFPTVNCEQVIALLPSTRKGQTMCIDTHKSNYSVN